MYVVSKYVSPDIYRALKRMNEVVKSSRIGEGMSSIKYGSRGLVAASHDGIAKVSAVRRGWYRLLGPRKYGRCFLD